MEASGILRGIARLTMVWPKTERRAQILKAGAVPGPAESGPASLYTSPKALTYPAVVGIVKISWEVCGKVFAPAATSDIFPLVACILIGSLIAVANLQEEKPTAIYYAIGLVIGLLNSLVLCGAVIGIPR